MTLAGFMRCSMLATSMVSSFTVIANDDTGSWGPVIDWNIIPIHAVLTPQGKVMTFGTNEYGGQGGEIHYSVWEPSMGVGADSRKLLPNITPTDIFCAAQVVLPDTGEVLLAGGDNGGPGNWGNPDTTLYSDTTDSISASPFKMMSPRWYPTTTTLPNGDIVVQGGSNNGVPGTGMLTPEVYNSSTGWRSLFGATSEFAYGDDFKRWWYPRSWILPDGRLFGISGPAMYFLDYEGNGAISAAGTFDLPNKGATSTAVMYEPGKILQVGGGHYVNGGGPVATNQASIIDLTNGQPQIVATQPMNYQRHWANSTVLPDGQVLVTGGSQINTSLAGLGAARHAELWNSQTGQWKLLAPEVFSRLYHSTALLLPDATVISGGGGAPGPENNLNAQIFYPPYLYNGSELAARPSYTLTDAQKAINYGDSLDFSVQSDTPISRVTLVKTGAVTHSFNSGQAFLELEFTTAGADLAVELPASSSLATPGFYMLFVIDSNGTPSVAEILHLAPESEQTPGLVKDGGFETMTPVQGGWLDFQAGASLGPWSVTAGGVSVHSNTHNALGSGGASGQRHLDLNGPTASKIEQNIEGLVAGELYTLSFDYALHSFAGGEASAQVNIANLDETWVATNIGSDQWLSASYNFVATDGANELSFSGLSGAACCGVLIDNVAINKVAPASTEIVNDGGFESSAPAQGGWINFYAGDQIGPWQVTAGGVSIHSNSHLGLGDGGATGANHLDLNGPINSKIEQTLTGLVAGQQYVLTFDYALHELAGGQASAQVLVADLDYEWTAYNVGSVAWESASVTFTASSSEEVLSLSGTAGADCCGVLIDNLQVKVDSSEELVEDGGFEFSEVLEGGWIDYLAGQKLGAWSVTSGGISVHSNSHNGLGNGGASGQEHLDLNGPTASNIEQDIDDLIEGQSYSLSFDYALHSFAGGSASAQVRIAGVDETWTATNIGSEQWLTANYSFVAGSSTEQLSFSGLSGAPCCGVLIDNVSIRAQ